MTAISLCILRDDSYNKKGEDAHKKVLLRITDYVFYIKTYLFERLPTVECFWVSNGSVKDDFFSMFLWKHI